TVRTTPPVCLALLHRLGDVVVARTDDFAKEEDCPFRWGEGFEEAEEGDRERVGELCLIGRAPGRPGLDRLRKPGPDVLLASPSCRAEFVETEVGHDAGEVATGGADLIGIELHPL